MGTGALRIHLNQFLECRTQGGLTPSVNLEEKSAHLRTTFACFQDQKPMPPPNKWGHAKKPVYEESRPPKPVLGTRNLSREHLARKDFLALMNKLTQQNKESILSTLKSVFREDCLDIYVTITWDMMQRLPEYQDIYMEVLTVIYQYVTTPTLWKEKWDQLWQKYLQHEEWVPPMPLHQGEGYDEFCDSVRWKKRALAALQAWVRLQRQGWILHVEQTMVPLLHVRCDPLLHATKGDGTTDMFLDAIKLLVPGQLGALEDMLRQWIDGWCAKANELRPATRFRVYDVRDELNKKLKPAYRSKRRTHGFS
jgi:hypothetical protein